MERATGERQSAKGYGTSIYGSIPVREQVERLIVVSLERDMRGSNTLISTKYTIGKGSGNPQSVSKKQPCQIYTFYRSFFTSESFVDKNNASHISTRVANYPTP
jgi:hypothetical protein